MEHRAIKVEIGSAKKETETLYVNGEAYETVTVSVSYSADVSVDGCEIRGTFKFKDDYISHEQYARDRIALLFQGGAPC